MPLFISLTIVFALLYRWREKYAHEEGKWLESAAIEKEKRQRFFAASVVVVLLFYLCFAITL